MIRSDLCDRPSGQVRAKEVCCESLNTVSLNHQDLVPAPYGSPLTANRWLHCRRSYPLQRYSRRILQPNQEGAETHREKPYENYKNANCCFEINLECNTHKRAAVRSLTSHLINHLSKTNKTCREHLEEKGQTHGRRSPNDSYSWLHEYCQTSKDFDTAALSGHWTQERCMIETDSERKTNDDIYGYSMVITTLKYMVLEMKSYSCGVIVSCCCCGFLGNKLKAFISKPPPLHNHQHTQLVLKCFCCVHVFFVPSYSTNLTFDKCF